MKTLAFLVLLALCAFQQWEIHDLIRGLQYDREVLNDTVWDMPGPPNIPREEAIRSLKNPPLN